MKLVTILILVGLSTVGATSLRGHDVRRELSTHTSTGTSSSSSGSSSRSGGNRSSRCGTVHLIGNNRCVDTIAREIKRNFDVKVVKDSGSSSTGSSKSSSSTSSSTKGSSSRRGRRNLTGSSTKTTKTSSGSSSRSSTGSSSDDDDDSYFVIRSDDCRDSATTRQTKDDINEDVYDGIKTRHSTSRADNCMRDGSGSNSKSSRSSTKSSSKSRRQ